MSSINPKKNTSIFTNIHINYFTMGDVRDTFASAALFPRLPSLDVPRISSQDPVPRWAAMFVAM